MVLSSSSTNLISLYRRGSMIYRPVERLVECQNDKSTMMEKFFSRKKEIGANQPKDRISISRRSVGVMCNEGVFSKGQVACADQYQWHS